MIDDIRSNPLTWTASAAAMLVYGYPLPNTSPLVTAKAIAILMLIAAAVRSVKTWSAFSRNIVIGLSFGLAGDIFLVAPHSVHFIPGLICFLIGHLFYIAAFLSIKRRAIRWGVPAIAAGGALYLAFLIWQLVGARNFLMIGPVSAYAIVILSMVYLGLSTGIRRVQAGVLFFLLSDSMLAIVNFVAHFPGERQLTWFTYYAAQSLIALAANREERPVTHTEK
jgi:uncharacterized membrane protein YhhN